jgi:hypothetical protein
VVAGEGESELISSHESEWVTDSIAVDGKTSPKYIVNDLVSIYIMGAIKSHMSKNVGLTPTAASNASQ